MPALEVLSLSGSVQLPVRHIISHGRRRGEGHGACVTHGSQRYGSGGQTYEASIAGMWLMNGISIVVTELPHNLADSLVVLFGKGGADNRFEPASVLGQYMFVCATNVHIVVVMVWAVRRPGPTRAAPHGFQEGYGHIEWGASFRKGISVWMWC